MNGASDCLFLLLAATLLAGLLGGDNGLEGGGGLECQSLGSLNLNLIAGLRVAAGASCANLHLKGAEAYELNLLIGFYSVGNGAEYSGESGLSAFFGCAFTEFCLNGVNKLCLIHMSL